jgi:hypothetical protein
MSNVISLQNLCAKTGLEDGTIRSITETDTDCTVQLVMGDVTGNISVKKDEGWVNVLIEKCAGWADVPVKSGGMDATVKVLAPKALPKKAAKRG